MNFGTKGLPEFHPQTVIRDWGNDQSFRLADAQTGVCVFGATGSGKTSGPAKHLAYGYLANDFGGLVLCAKKEERHQWEKWAADCGRTDDLVIITSKGDHRFNFLEWEASRPEEGGGLTINNHPSGESSPSEADIKVTRDLIRAGQLLKMEVIDHVVMGNGNRSSLRELGYFYA